MALIRDILGIKLGQGIDTKTDPKHVIAGKLLALENATFERVGSLKKAFGFRTHNVDDLPDSLTGCKVYKDELLAIGAEHLYSYSPAKDGWMNRGWVANTTPMIDVIATGLSVEREGAPFTNELSHVDSATNGNYRMFVWEQPSNSTVYAVLYDVQSNARIVDKFQVDSKGGSKPKVLPLGDYDFVVLWIDDNDYLACRVYDAASEVWADAEATLVSHAITCYDACRLVQSTTGDERIIVVSSSTSDANYAMSGVFLYEGVPTYMVGYTWQDSGDPRPSTLTVFPSGETGDNVPTFIIAWNFYEDSGGGGPYSWDLYATAWDWDLATQEVSDTKIDSLSSNSDADGVPYGLTGCYRGGAVGGSECFTLFCSVTPDDINGHTDPFIRESWCNSWSSTTAADRAFGCEVQAKCVLRSGTLSTSRIALPVLFRARPRVAVGGGYEPNPIQAQLFVLEVADYADTPDGAPLPVMASLLPGQGLLVPQGYTAPPETGLDGSSVQFACPMLQAVIPTAASVPLADEVIAFVSLEYGSHQSSVPMADCLHLSGGFLQMYDGSTIAEHGFHLYPEGVEVDTMPLAAHSYQYRVLYEWTDLRGRVHRSAPSIAVTSLQTNEISAVDTVTVSIPTLRLTAKTNVRCVVYRTIDTGAIFYRVGSVASSTLGDTVTYEDGISDSALAAAEQLYTTGGVLENISIGAVGQLSEWRERIVAIDPLDGLSCTYSKRTQRNAPVEMSDFFRLTVDSVGGDLTATGVVDDKLILLKTAKIFVVQGIGPDSTGAQDDLSPPYPLPTDVGCAEPISVVSFAQGLLFKSEKGFYLLDRSLNVNYVGAPVEAYNSATVTSAVVVTVKNHIRYGLDSGVVLLYDYLLQQWSVLTDIASVDACVYGGNYVYVTSTTSVRVEDTAFGADSIAPRMKLTTSWLKLTEIQGYQRAYELLLIGEYRSAHKLTVQIAYDYDPTVVHTTTIMCDSGTAGDVLQHRVHFERQRCEAFQVTIYDTVLATSASEGFALSALSVLAGIKKGPMRLPSTQSHG